MMPASQTPPRHPAASDRGASGSGGVQQRPNTRSNSPLVKVKQQHPQQQSPAAVDAKLDKIHRNIAIDGFSELRTVPVTSEGIRVLRTRRVQLNQQQPLSPPVATIASHGRHQLPQPSASQRRRKRRSPPMPLPRPVKIEPVELEREIDSDPPIVESDESVAAETGCQAVVLRRESGTVPLVALQRLVLQPSLLPPSIPGLSDCNDDQVMPIYRSPKFDAHQLARMECVKIAARSAIDFRQPPAIAVAFAELDLLIRWRTQCCEYYIAPTAQSQLSAEEPADSCISIEIDECHEASIVGDAAPVASTAETTEYLHESQIRMDTLPPIILTEQPPLSRRRPAAFARHPLSRNNSGSSSQSQSSCRTFGPIDVSDSEATLSALDDEMTDCSKSAAVSPRPGLEQQLEALTVAVATTTTAANRVVLTALPNATASSCTVRRSPTRKFLDSMQIPEGITISKKPIQPVAAASLDATAASSVAADAAPVVIFAVASKQKRPWMVANEAASAASAASGSGCEPAGNSANSAKRISAIRKQLSARQQPPAAGQPQRIVVINSSSQQSQSLAGLGLRAVGRGSASANILRRQARPAVVSATAAAGVRPTNPAITVVPASQAVVAARNIPSSASVNPTVIAPRGRGRPRKNPLPTPVSTTTTVSTFTASPSPASSSAYVQSPAPVIVRRPRPSSEFALNNQVSISLVHNSTIHSLVQRPNIPGLSGTSGINRSAPRATPNAIPVQSLHSSQSSYSSSASHSQSHPPALKTDTGHQQPCCSPQHLLDTNICANCCEQDLAYKQYFDHQNVSLLPIRSATAPTTPSTPSTPSASANSSALTHQSQPNPIIHISSDSDDSEQSSQTSDSSSDCLDIRRPRTNCERRDAGTQLTDVDIELELCGPDAFPVPGAIKAIRQPPPPPVRSLLALTSVSWQVESAATPASVSVVAASGSAAAAAASAKAAPTLHSQYLANRLQQVLHQLKLKQQKGQQLATSSTVNCGSEAQPRPAHQQQSAAQDQVAVPFRVLTSTAQSIVTQMCRDGRFANAMLAASGSGTSSSKRLVTLSSNARVVGRPKTDGQLLCSRLPPATMLGAVKRGAAPSSMQRQPPRPAQRAAPTSVSSASAVGVIVDYLCQQQQPRQQTAPLPQQGSVICSSASSARALHLSATGEMLLCDSQQLQQQQRSQMPPEDERDERWADLCSLIEQTSEAEQTLIFENAIDSTDSISVNLSRDSSFIQFAGIRQTSGATTTDAQISTYSNHLRLTMTCELNESDVMYTKTVTPTATLQKRAREEAPINMSTRKCPRYHSPSGTSSSSSSSCARGRFSLLAEIEDYADDHMMADNLEQSIRMEQLFVSGDDFNYADYLL